MTTYAILTVSDRCSAGEATDRSGPALVHAIEEEQFGIIKRTSIVPDDIVKIREEIQLCCDSLKVNVLLTTGGTGLADRDVTPEATQPLLDKVIPLFSTKLMLDGLRQTPFAILNRGVVGMRKKTLVINLPGSTNGAVCGLKALSTAIPHAIDLMLDRKTAVMSSHGEHLNAIKSKVIVNTDESTRVRFSKWPMFEMSNVPKLLWDHVAPLPILKVKSADSVGYIVGESITASEDLPIERTSMKDGYAIFKATKENYRIVGECKPGELTPALQNVDENTAYKVSTGSYVPRNTFCVVPVEDTEPNDDGTIRLKRDFALCEDIRSVGCDIKKGATALEKNALIGPAEIGVLATISRPEISVFRRPVIAVLSTGDELEEPWVLAQDGKIRDCNRSVLLQLLQQWGFKTVDLQIALDEPNEILPRLCSGFDSADVVITTGGMSMGERDLLKEILQQDLGAEIHFGRLRMKPGKPSGFATLLYKSSLKYWFGLPGNPASAFVTAHLIVLPALRILSGWSKNVFMKRMSAEAQCRIKKDPERVEFVRGVVSSEDEDENIVFLIPRVQTTGTHLQQSSCIKGCSEANCLIEVPSGEGYIVRNERVIVHMLP